MVEYHDYLFTALKASFDCVFNCMMKFLKAHSQAVSNFFKTPCPDLNVTYRIKISKHHTIEYTANLF